MKIILKPISAYWYFRIIVIHENKEHFGKKNSLPYLEQTHIYCAFKIDLQLAMSLISLILILKFNFTCDTFSRHS